MPPKPKQLVVKWVQGTDTNGKTIYINCNMVASVEQYNEDEYVLHLGGGGKVYLRGCVSLDGYPPFLPEEE